MSSTGASPAALPAQLVQLEVLVHGPSWQRRVRFALGSGGRSVTHGQGYLSTELVTLLTELLLASGQPCRIIDRSGPEPISYGIRDR
jgi:hypothetical protein